MYRYFMQLNISGTPNRYLWNSSFIRQLQTNLHLQRIVNVRNRQYVRQIKLLNT
jgi:hypothetical protein